MTQCTLDSWPVAACLIAFMALAGVLAWRFFNILERND